MSHLEIIESLITDEINLDWFKNKNLSFISDEAYDSELNIILKKVYENNDIYDEINGELIIVDTEVIQLPDFEYKFSDYCWIDIAYIEIIHNHDFTRPEKMIDAYWICNDIIETIDEILPKDSISQSYNLIQATLRTIEDTFDQLSKSITDDEMSEASNLLKIMFTQSIQFRFSQIFELDTLAGISFDSLKFNVNKSELTGFIAILIEADILELPKTGGRYDFFEKYFRWLDGNGTFQTLRNTKGDISKIKSQDSIDRRTKGALDVFGKLEEGFNNL